MNPLLKIREEVLKQITPTKDENKRGYEIFSQLKKAIYQVTNQRKLEIAFIELEGSFGRKQTHLRNWRELDVFIGLPIEILPKPKEPGKLEKKVIKKLLNKLVRKVALESVKIAGCQDAKIAFAEHPYITAGFDDFKVDVVFCFDLSSNYILEHGPVTAVDRTPHHSRFVDEHLTKDQRDDVRLLKAFFQTAYVYGDSSPVGRSGFTGFSTEMIIYHLNDTVSAFKYLQEDPIAPLDFFKRSDIKLRQRFKKEQFIIVDPTDPNRNVASSISNRALKFAQTRIQHLISKPTPEFFMRRAIPVLSESELTEVGLNYFVFEFEDRTGWHYTKTRDKLYRYFTRLERFLKQEPTRVSRFGKVLFEEVFEGNHYAIALWVENPQIEMKYIRTGPPPNLKQAVKRFKEKHPSAILRNGRLHVEIIRPFTTAEQAIRNYLQTQTIAAKLHLVNFSNTGSTKVGKQALWILKEAVIPIANM